MITYMIYIFVSYKLISFYTALQNLYKNTFAQSYLVLWE